MIHEGLIPIHPEGGYDFNDFPKLGAPLTLILLVVTILMVPSVY